MDQIGLPDFTSFTTEAITQPTLPDFVRSWSQEGPRSGENFLRISIFSPLQTAVLGSDLASKE